MEHLKQLYNFSVDDSSICRWIRKFTRLVQPYVDGLVPKTGGVYHVDEMLLHVRKENNEKTMSHSDEESHTHKQFDNHYSWLWNLMDSTTRFWISSRLSQRRYIQAGVPLLKEMKKHAPLPKAFVHDGLRVYDEVLQQRIIHIEDAKNSKC